VFYLENVVYLGNVFYLENVFYLIESVFYIENFFYLENALTPTNSSIVYRAEITCNLYQKKIFRLYYRCDINKESIGMTSLVPLNKILLIV